MAKIRYDEWIDVDLVERILREGNHQELIWLRDHLETGVKVLNSDDKRLSTNKFLDLIDEGLDD